MASSKVAYVAFGEDASVGFAGDDVLNRPSSRSLEDPPWKVFDSDVQFQPMFVEGFAPIDGDEDAVDNSAKPESPNEGELGTEGALSDNDNPVDSGQTEADTSEWAEVAEIDTIVPGISEDEVLNRIEEAVANVRAQLIDEYTNKIAELEASIAVLKEEHQTECLQIKEQTASEIEAKVENTIQNYRELTKKIRTASTRVSEFFEPLSRLSVHIAEQLVRGELNVGPVAITRLVQGCLDAIEERASEKEPVLKMHPADLEMFLRGFDGEPVGVSLLPDDRLARGDVSLQMDHSVIDDLLAHRLEEIAQYVFGRSTSDSDLLLNEETNSIASMDSTPADVAEEEFIDPGEDFGETPDDAEPAFSEMESHLDDQVTVDESGSNPEQTVLSESVDYSVDDENAASEPVNDIDEKLASDDRDEGPASKESSESDDLDDTVK